MKEQTGVAPEDIQSLTMGISGLSAAIASGQPPTPDNVDFALVVRTSGSISMENLRSKEPDATVVTHGSAEYLRASLSDSPIPIAVWLAESPIFRLRIDASHDYLATLAIELSNSTGHIIKRNYANLRIS